jgi:hypothetical protein
MIKELIKNSEKEGTRGVKSHASIKKGEFFPNIQVSNSLKNNAKFQSKFEMGCYSNTTVWELRKELGIKASRVYNEDGTFFQDTPVNPASIRIFKSIGCMDLKENENGKTLAELRFKHNETLTGFKKNIFLSPKVPLLDDSKLDMADHPRAIFTEWFELFSEEDLDHPGQRVMTPQTCVEFIKSCTGENCALDDDRVLYMFTTYDLDHDDKINYTDFMKFYTNCCLEKEDVVRSNLY